MPVFEYKALDARGKPVSGMLDAADPKALRGMLRKDGIFLTEIVVESKVKSLASREVKLGRGRIKALDISVMTRQLATLIGAGIPLVESLTALVDQVEKERLKKVLSQIRERVNEGSSLADAMGDHPKVFVALYVNMIRAGESSGTLDVVLNRLAEFTDYQVRLRSKVMGAMMYPIIMVIVAIIIVAVLFVVVVPKITKIFERLKEGLPLPTEILIAVSSFVKNWWWAILLVGFGTIFLLVRYFRYTEAGREKWDRFALKVPIFGSLTRMIAIARFTKTLSTLLASGVPLLTALNIVKNVLNNKILEKVVEEARVSIQEGESIAAPLKRSKEFPPIVTHMIAIGEKSGELESMLSNVAAAYEQQVDNKINTLTSLLEPIMIVSMGGVVGFIVFSILLPILKMNQALGKGGG
jgi:general secretion pathway protein F